MLDAKTTAGLLLITVLLGSTVRAEIYRCKDDDGNLMFSQTPCANEEPVVVKTSAPAKADADCSYANRFAVTTARLMRGGLMSDEVFNRYGGLDALSKGSVGVINYVFLFRTNGDVTIERIAGLTQAKCQAGSFGDVSCEALPQSVTDGFGGCDAGEDQESPLQAAQVTAQAQPLGEPQLASTTSSSSSSGRDAGTRDEELTQQCKKRYRDQIDAIDAEMRGGYSSSQGERYREQLRGLTEGLRAC